MMRTWWHRGLYLHHLQAWLVSTRTTPIEGIGTRAAAVSDEVGRGMSQEMQKMNENCNSIIIFYAFIEIHSQSAPRSLSIDA